MAKYTNNLHYVTTSKSKGKYMKLTTMSGFRSKNLFKFYLFTINEAQTWADWKSNNSHTQTQTKSRQTYRIDNAFECVEAIFDRKHLVLGVRNHSKLLVSWGSWVNKKYCWFNAAFFFFCFPLYDWALSFLSYHGQEET